MPLGSLSTLGWAGPNGTPLIAELPAPADPAGGVSCAYALAGATKLPSSRMRTSGKLRDIESFRGWRSNDYVGVPIPRRYISPSVRFWGQKHLFDPVPITSPGSGHRQGRSACLKSANKRLMHCSKFDV